MGDEKYSSSHSKPRPQNSADLYTGTHRTGGRVGPKAGLDASEKGNFCPCRESNNDSSVVQPVASTLHRLVIMNLKREERNEQREAVANSCSGRE
jgi:hypothetical protein